MISHPAGGAIDQELEGLVGKQRDGVGRDSEVDLHGGRGRPAARMECAVGRLSQGGVDLWPPPATPRLTQSTNKYILR